MPPCLRFAACLLGLTILTTDLSFAQEGYKCKTATGHVYQDRPCKVEAPTPGKSAGASATTGASPRDIGKETCRTAAATAVAWKDPDSLKIGTIYGGQMELLQIGASPVGSRLYAVAVNAKNSYGAYDGEKELLCYTSEDGRRVLRIDTSRFSQK